MLTLLSLTACSGTGAATPDRLSTAVPPTGPLAAGNVTVQLGERPFLLHVPSSYRPGTAMPLIVALHGHGSSAATLERYLRLAAESDRRGFLYAMPDGTVGPDGRRFWNATAVCCDYYGTGVDDSDYLRRLLVEIAAAYSVDRRRVYIVGHSNGGYMAYRMACDHAELITAIVSLAGAMFRDLTRCRPARPVSDCRFMVRPTGPSTSTATRPGAGTRRWTQPWPTGGASTAARTRPTRRRRRKISSPT